MLKHAVSNRSTRPRHQEYFQLIAIKIRGHRTPNIVQYNIMYGRAHCCAVQSRIVTPTDVMAECELVFDVSKNPTYSNTHSNGFIVRWKSSPLWLIIFDSVTMEVQYNCHACTSIYLYHGVMFSSDNKESNFEMYNAPNIVHRKTIYDCV